LTTSYIVLHYKQLIIRKGTNMKLVKQLQALKHVTVMRDPDEEVYFVSVNLGKGFAGQHNGWLWGDVAITNDELTFNTAIDCTDQYGDGEISMWEGTVHLDYVKGSGLAYTGALETAICDKLKERTNGLLEAHGSEQGMQGEDYLSCDVVISDESRKLVA